MKDNNQHPTANYYNNQTQNNGNQFKSNPFYQKSQISGKNNSENKVQQNPRIQGKSNIKSIKEEKQNVDYIPYSTIIRIEEPYKDISYGNLGGQ